MRGYAEGGIKRQADGRCVEYRRDLFRFEFIVREDARLPQLNVEKTMAVARS